MEAPHMPLILKRNFLLFLKSRAFFELAGAFSLALLLGRVSLFGKIFPFGPAFAVAADMAGLNVLYPLFGALIGALLCGADGYAALLSLGLYALLVLGLRLWKKQVRRADKLMLLCAAKAVMLPVFFLGSFDVFFLGLADALASLIFTTAFFNGLKALKSANVRRRLLEEEQVALVLLFGGAALAVSDASIFAFSLGLVLTAWICIFAAYSKGLLAVACAVLLGGMLVLGGKAQPLLIANLAICTLAAAVLRRLGIWGAIAGFLLACAVSQGYSIGIFTQVGMANAIPAGLAAALMPKRSLLALRAAVDPKAREERTAATAYTSIKAHTAQSISSTAKTLEQVAALFPNNPKWGYDEKSEHERMHSAAMNICADCSFRGACWKEPDAAVEALFEMIKAYSSGLRPRPCKPIKSDCRRTTALAQAALAAQDAYRQSCMDGFNSQAQQAFAHRQLAGVSKVMHTLAKDLSDAPWPKEGAGATLVRQLEKEGFPAKSALVYSHRSCLRAEVKLHRRKKPAYYEGQLENAVSAALNKQMRLLFSQTEAALDVYDFEEAGLLYASAGSATLPKPASTISGDSTASCNLACGRALYVLSDGMGSGALAAKQSAAAVELMCRLYETGFSRDEALECVNRLLMLKRENEVYATLDALCIDLETGGAEFIKFGAPPSFVLREGRVHTIYAEALPAGILTEAVPAIHCASLKQNDSIVLLTDGTLEALKEETEQLIIECVGGANTCADAAAALLNAAAERGAKDDMSAVVVRLEQRTG